MFPMQEVWIWPLVRELRPHMLLGTAKGKTKERKNSSNSPYLLMGFPCSLVSKESAFSAGDPGSVSGLGRSLGEGNGNPLQYPWPEKSHVQRSLVGCSSWGHKESGMTERLTLTLSLSLNTFKLIYMVYIHMYIHAYIFKS